MHFKTSSSLCRIFQSTLNTPKVNDILADKKFCVSQYQRIKVRSFDRYPAMADLKFDGVVGLL